MASCNSWYVFPYAFLQRITTNDYFIRQELLHEINVLNVEIFCPLVTISHSTLHNYKDDLVRKSFVDVCGDLNVVVLILFGINLCLLDLDKPSGVTFVIGGMKLWMAYFGQFSHMSAHAFSKSRKSKSVAVWLQKYGLMISPKEHMAHHKPPHDLDFCLIGLCNPIIDTLRKITTNNMIWLIAFLIWSIFDIYVYVKLVEGFTSVIAL